MPKKQLSDPFVRNVRFERVEVPSKRDPSKTVVQTQISYFEKLDRGVSLSLTVSYGGTKAWAVVTYRDGQPQWRKLGTYPSMSLRQAREAARAHHFDPKKFEQQAEVGSFKDVAESWFKRHVIKKGLRSQDEIRRHLERYVYPKWATRKFLEIGRLDVTHLLDHIEDDHGSCQADAVLATVRGVMSWHQTRGDHYICPVVRGMRRSSNSSRKRILNDDELRALWSAANHAGRFGAFVKLCLLTAQRQGKVTTVRWDDIAEGTWTISKADREKGTAEKIKLPAVALEIIDKLPRIMGNPYVFAGKGSKAFNSHWQRKDELDKSIKQTLPDMPRRTLHDLRRTARSLMSRAGVPRDHAERVLGHVIAGVEGTYDRHSYEKEKADALAKLANLIENILDPQDNVVPLHKVTA